MSSLAQEESRSISENCIWGQRKRFADGKVTVPFERFQGYDRGEDGNLIVNPEQEKVVKKIYRLFLQGYSPFGIAKELTGEGILTPGGKKKWSSRTVEQYLVMRNIKVMHYYKSHLQLIFYLSQRKRMRVKYLNTM